MMKRFMQIVAPFAILAVVGAMNPEKDDMRQFQEIVFENGYSLEHYSLVTKDDYVLTLYRIPGKFAEAK